MFLHLLTNPLIIASLGSTGEIKSYDVANECIVFFNCSVSDGLMLYTKEKIKFLTKLQYSENIICKLFEKKNPAMNYLLCMD